jgi:hypothetical protein
MNKSEVHLVSLSVRRKLHLIRSPSNLTWNLHATHPIKLSLKACLFEIFSVYIRNEDVEFLQPSINALLLFGATHLYGGKPLFSYHSNETKIT